MPKARRTFISKNLLTDESVPHRFPSLSFPLMQSINLYFVLLSLHTANGTSDSHLPFLTVFLMLQMITASKAWVDSRDDE